MANFFASIIGMLGGPFGVLGGVVTGQDTGLIGGLLGLNPKGKRPDMAETQLREPVSPRVYCYGTRRVYGNIDLFQTSADGAAVDVLSYLDGRISAVPRIYLNDKQVTVTSGIVQPLADGSYKDDNVKVGFNLGLATETAFAPVVAKLPTIWTTDHRGDGIVSGYLIKEPVKAKHFLEIYPQGDNIQLSAVFDAQLCFDPREVSHDINDPDTWAFAYNGVLQLLHYFVVRLGYDYTTRILPKIDMWKDAADICDESISLSAGGTEARYRSSVMYDSTAEPSEVIASLLETFDGWYAVNSENQLIIYAGAYYAPSVTIGPEHITEYEHQAYVEDENFYNEFAITYISSLHDYNEVDCDPWRDDVDISARGAVNSQGISPQTPSFTQNRRLAKMLMARTNAPDRGSIKTNYAGRIAEGERFITLNLVEAGTTLFSGPVEIVAVTRNSDTGGITFEWVKADSTAWDWDNADDGQGAPVGDSATLDTLTTPTITGVTATYDAAQVNAVLVVSVSALDRADLTWYLRWKPNGTTDWHESQYDDLDPGATVQIQTGTVPVDSDVDLQVSYATGTGQNSAWSSTYTFTTDAPALGGNLDGGNASSVYGGTDIIDGGSA